MTAEEERAQLKRELAAERAKSARLEGELARERAGNASLREMLEEVLRRLSEVEGQSGHPGQTLKIVERPDEVVRHRPVICQHCQHPLEEVAGRVKERRQVHDLPEVRLRVCEHQVEEVCCPACGQQNVGSFPAEAMAPVQYGPNVQALAV